MYDDIFLSFTSNILGRRFTQYSEIKLDDVHGSNTSVLVIVKLRIVLLCMLQIDATMQVISLSCLIVIVCLTEKVRLKNSRNFIAARLFCNTVQQKSQWICVIFNYNSFAFVLGLRFNVMRYSMIIPMYVTHCLISSNPVTKYHLDAYHLTKT